MKTSIEIAETMTSLHGAAIRRLLRSAGREPWTGKSAPSTRQRAVWPTPNEPGRMYSILLTFDVGYHACGWWRNSQYDRCWHLSLTVIKAGAALSQAAFETPELVEVQGMARAFFGDNVRFGWVEPPASAFDSYRTSESGRHVYHLRIFVDRVTGQAIQPQGEVYDLIPFDDGTSPEKIFR